MTPAGGVVRQLGRRPERRPAGGGHRPARSAVTAVPFGSRAPVTEVNWPEPREAVVGRGQHAGARPTPRPGSRNRTSVGSDSAVG